MGYESDTGFVLKLLIFVEKICTFIQDVDPELDPDPESEPKLP